MKAIGGQCCNSTMCGDYLQIMWGLWLYIGQDIGAKRIETLQTSYTTVISTVITEDWSDLAVSSTSPFVSHLFFNIFIIPSTQTKKTTWHLPISWAVTQDYLWPGCVWGSIGRQPHSPSHFLKAAWTGCRYEIRKVYCIRRHTYDMEARMTWWSPKLDNEAWSHPRCLSLEEKQPLFLEIVVSATGSKVFVCFYGDGITPNNTATLGYLAKKTSDEQPMAYISSCRFLIYTNIYI